MRRPPAGLLCFVVLLAAGEARAQNWTFRPVFTFGIGYDSNIVFTPDAASAGDFLGGIGVRAPLAGRIGPKSTFSMNYGATGEFYQDFKNLDHFPSTQNASIGWSYVPDPKSNLALGVGYSESRRPEDVFPLTGLGFLRGKTRNASGSATYSRRLGRRTGFDVGYLYGRPYYEAFEGFNPVRSENHNVNAGIGRDVGARGNVSLQYQYVLYLGDPDFRDESQYVGLGIRQGIGGHTTLSLNGGARFRNGEVELSLRPEGNITLGHSWRRSSVSVSVGSSRQYVPTTAGFSETNSAGATYALTLQRVRFSLGGGFSRNRFEGGPDDASPTFDSWTGSFESVYQVQRWLGVGASYRYIGQRSPDGNPIFDRTRHTAFVGITVSPLNERDIPGLR